MQEKLINVNADVVDVKELVNKLINKLPDVNMNIKGLSLQSGPKNG